MELESIDYEKCLEILPASSIEEDVKAVPSYLYSQAEIQHLTVLHFDQWKGIGLVNVPPTPLVSSTQNIHMNVKGQVKKRPREEAIEEAAKALFELSSLRDLAKLAIKTEQQLIQPYYRKSNSLTTSVFVPLQQRMVAMSSRFSTSRILLREALNKCESSIQNHAIIVHKLENLGKHWKLLTPRNDLVGRDSSAILSKDSVLSVDCSLVSQGDHPSTAVDYLVPLSIDGNRLVIPQTVLTRHVSTLEFQLCHRELGILTQVTAWEIANQDKQLIPTDLEDDLKVIDDFCRRLQHDALSSRLFGRLRYNALDFKSNWILKRSNPLYPSSHSNDLIIDILRHDSLMRDIEIWSLERGSLQIALSGNLSIRISLVPISLDAPMNRSAVDLPFQSCIIQAYKTAQCYLFYHFCQSLLESTNSSAVTSKNMTSQSTNVEMSINSVMGRSKPIDLEKMNRGTVKDSSKDKVVSALEAFMNVLRVKIWNMLIDAYTSKDWQLHLVKTTISAGTDEVLSTLANHQNSDFAEDMYDYDVDCESSDNHDKKISLRITDLGYEMKVFSVTKSSISSTSTCRNFTCTNDLLVFLQSSTQ